MGSKQKGSAFEREICKKLSLWWSGGRDDTVFWRSQSSGGRATQRATKGQTTKGQYGDIAADGEAGRRLIDLFMIELKRGYNDASPLDLVDRMPRHKEQVFEEWMRKLQDSLHYSGSLSWWIIHKKDQRQPMVYVPNHTVSVLRDEGMLKDRLTCRTNTTCFIRRPDPDEPGEIMLERLHLVGTPLDEWLKVLDAQELISFDGIL